MYVKCNSSNIVFMAALKRVLLIILCFFIPITSFSQIQRGNVKTKGRMENGMLVPGQGLKGAVVSVRGRTAILVDNDEGYFSFPVPDIQFQIDSVMKKGYRLVDMDACPRTYSYSENQIYIVMETPERQLQDQLAAERKIRRNLQKQLQNKEDEIERLKAEQKISDDEYRKALQKLYQDQENNEQLIKDMAKRYSALDYDQLDEFYRKVSYFIENGELVKADSLLHTKGDVAAQVEKQLHKGQVLKDKEEEINRAMAVYRADAEELSRRCYSYYETYAAQHMNDTAAYYLELRASLDTTNVEWQHDAGIYIRDYLADYNKSISYFERELKQSDIQYGNNSEWSARAYYNIGLVYLYSGDLDKSLFYHEIALNIRKDILGVYNLETALSYNDIGVLFQEKGDYSNSLNYLDTALNIRITLLGEKHKEIAESYNNIGVYYTLNGVLNKDLEYHNKALEIRRSLYGDNHQEVAQSYDNIGHHYFAVGIDSLGFDYCLKALNIYKTVYGEKHPEVALSYYAIGKQYKNIGDLQKALEFLFASLKIRQSIFENNHPSIANSYFQIGNVYNDMEDYNNALECYEKTLSIDMLILGLDHPYTIEDKEVIESVRVKLKELEQ